MKITIKNVFENVLFEHTCENNTLLKTLKEALKEGIDLKYVNLSGVKWSYTDLN
jgi:DNA-directed RNA polymerase subunit L